MEKDEFEANYAAISARDSRFDGSLYFAVTTTGIFCRPTCGARRPLRENVRFFKSAKAALAHGFRPCKRCQPLALPGETPPEITALLDELEAAPDQPLRDRDLMARGLAPERVRRWFQRRHGMTFQAFQRQMRLNRSYNSLAMGESVTGAAFDAGYESLSGFQERFKTVIGTSPGTAPAVKPMLFERFATPLGPMMAAAVDDKLCLLEFCDRRGLETELKDLKKRLGRVFLPGRSDVIDQTRQQLAAYFAGELSCFDLPLFCPGTPFQQAVWAELQSIAYGTTRSYKEQATRLGKPKAVRAVARANGQNRIAIVIPCHRVIGSDGSLTGYAGGLSRKRWLLEREGISGVISNS